MTSAGNKSERFFPDFYDTTPQQQQQHQGDVLLYRDCSAYVVVYIKKREE